MPNSMAKPAPDTLTFRENRSMSQAPGPLWSIITNRFKLAGLLMILLPVLLVTLDNTILNFALPKIAVALGPLAPRLPNSYG